MLQCKEGIAKALGGGRVEADEKWVIVKVHDLPTRVTILDDNNSLTSRDVTIEQDVLPEIAGNCVLGQCTRRVPVRLAFRAEGLKDFPRMVMLMGARRIPCLQRGKTASVQEMLRTTQNREL